MSMLSHFWRSNPGIGGGGGTIVPAEGVAEVAVAVGGVDLVTPLVVEAGQQADLDCATIAGGE